MSLIIAYKNICTIQNELENWWEKSTDFIKSGLKVYP